MAAKRALLDDASTLLFATIVILDSPQSWARRAYALDSRGRSVAVDDPKAIRFCLAGGILRAEHLYHGTPMPVRTDPAADRDDLLAPIAPPQSAPRLHLALQLIAIASGWELQRLGMRFRLVEAESAGPLPTTVHRTLLLGLHPKAKFGDCDRVLAQAIALVTWLGRNDERLDEAILDEATRT